MSEDWNTAGNWMPATVPNGPADTATFSVSSTNYPSVSADTTVNGIVFDPGASEFTMTVTPSRTLTLSGAGITNDSGVTQTFVAEVDIDGNMGRILFTGNATAGEGTLFINPGGIGAVEDGGHTEFYDNASAGSGTFIANAASANGFHGGQTEFHDNSTAANGTFTANGTTGNGPNGGMTQFFESSNAGNGSFTANGGTFDGGSTIFNHMSRAGNGTFITNGGDANGQVRGETVFNGSSSADHGTFITNGAMTTDAGGGQLLLTDLTTADNATMIVNGGGVSGAEGGEISIIGESSAGNATIIINGGEGAGGNCGFGDRSQGGTARMQIFGNGTLTILGIPNRGFTVGSIEGDGRIAIFSRETLAVGSNNADTLFSGVIENFGSLTKVGSGVLTLTGANTYMGRSTLEDGGLVIDNPTGSGTGTGPVQVNGGTLAGRGTIAGAVTVGTGSGAGAFLAPALGAAKPTTLTIQSALTFKADATYIYRLNLKKAKSDQVVARGVTIESGAQFDFNAVGGGRLRPGKSATVISNTAATAIAGAFANLADGSTFRAGRNNFQVSYSGGDGNDLTLTVVP